MVMLIYSFPVRRFPLHIESFGHHSVLVVSVQEISFPALKSRNSSFSLFTLRGCILFSLFAIFLLSFSHQLIYLSGAIIIDPQSVLHYPKQAIIHIVTFAFALLTCRSQRPSVTESHKTIPLPVI